MSSSCKIVLQSERLQPLSVTNIIKQCGSFFIITSEFIQMILHSSEKWPVSLQIERKRLVKNDEVV